MKPATLAPIAPYQAEVLDALRHRLPDYLAARGVELRKNGTRLVGRCPRHDDASPSFAVFGIHHETCGCYPCGFTGDVFDVALWLGRASTFPEAVQDVAAAVGYCLPHATAGRPTMAATAPHRPAKQPEPPFILPDADREKIRVARLAFSDALDLSELDGMAAELGIPTWALRWCAMGESGLGMWNDRLAYIYPQGLKLRHPAGHKPRFEWVCGKATVPWRAEWIRPSTRTVYLTEGESDCMALVAADMESDKTVACVASPGTSFLASWVPLFAGKKVVLCFDLDAAGQAATAKVAAMLKGTAAEILTWRGIKQ
jgi:hypothetical protein